MTMAVVYCCQVLPLGAICASIQRDVAELHAEALRTGHPSKTWPWQGDGNKSPRDKITFKHQQPGTPATNVPTIFKAATAAQQPGSDDVVVSMNGVADTATGHAGIDQHSSEESASPGRRNFHGLGRWLSQELQRVGGIPAVPSDVALAGSGTDTDGGSVVGAAAGRDYADVSSAGVPDLKRANYAGQSNTDPAKPWGSATASTASAFSASAAGGDDPNKAKARHKGSAQ